MRGTSHVGEKNIHMYSFQMLKRASADLHFKSCKGTNSCRGIFACSAPFGLEFPCPEYPVIANFTGKFDQIANICLLYLLL